MANTLPHNASHLTQVLIPACARWPDSCLADTLLHRGFKPQRALMHLLGNAGRIRNVPVAAVNQHVTVRLHRPASLPDRAPALLWIHGGGTSSVAAQDDKYLRELFHLTGVAVAAEEHRLAPGTRIRSRSKTVMRRYYGWRTNLGRPR